MRDGNRQGLRKQGIFWELIAPKIATGTDKCFAPSLCQLEQRWTQPSLLILFGTVGICCSRVPELSENFLSLRAVRPQCL